MPVYDLSPAVQPITTVNVAEDVRGPSTPITGSPFTVTTTPITVLPANASRATASIINTGSASVLLREGATPVISATSYSFLLPPNRMWEPDSNFRFTGAMQAMMTSGTTTLVVSESIIIP